MNNELRQLIEDSVNRRRDSVRENELIARLRKLAAIDALETVKELVNRNAPCAYVAAKRVLSQRREAMNFFTFALPVANPYSIQFVLDFGVAKLGLRRVIDALSSLKATHPKQFENAMYYLPRIVSVEELPKLDILMKR